MSYNSTHTGSQIDDAVDKVLNGSVPKADKVSHTLTINGISYDGSESKTVTISSSADKLNTDAGSAINPVYFLNGIPVKTTYTLGASVPSNAVFTDTTYGIASSSAAGLVKIGFTESGKDYPIELNSDGQMFVNVPWTDTDTNTHYKAVPHAGTNSSTSATATTNGNTYINIVENDSRSGGINIKGTGATTVTSDTSGVITINSTDTNTDTKNTAGSTDTSSKIFLVGAISQAANPQTYSHDTAYVGTDGCLYSNGTKVSVEGHTHDAVKIVRWS